MNKYIVIVHGWHVYSEGFSVHEIEAESDEKAEEKACYLEVKETRDFRKCAHVVVKVDHKLPPSRRKLKLWERISGYAVL